MFIINTSFILWEKAISLWFSLTVFFSKNLLNLLSLEVMILIFELFRGGLGIKFHVCNGFLLGLQMTFCCYSVALPFCWEVSHHFNKIEAPYNVFDAFMAMFITPPLCAYILMAHRTVILFLFLMLSSCGLWCSFRMWIWVYSFVVEHPVCTKLRVQSPGMQGNPTHWILKHLGACQLFLLCSL